MIVKAFGIIISFPSTTILLTNSCISLRVLGTLNGFATAFSGVGRALGPATTGIVFSWGAGTGYMVSAYFFLGLVAALGAIPVFMIVEGDGPTDTADCSDVDEDEAASCAEASMLPDESAVEESSEEEEEESLAKATPSDPLMSKGPRRQQEPSYGSFV